MHSTVSFDGNHTPREMAEAAQKKGLVEICFTDHADFAYDPADPPTLPDPLAYSQAYDDLRVEGLTVRRGIELGLTAWNTAEAGAYVKARPYDFVIGSVHNLKNGDPYFLSCWEGKTREETFEEYLCEVLRCVKVHENFDVLGHLTYVCKSSHNPGMKPLRYADFPDLCDEIMKILAQKGKGMEVNTSGVVRVGEFLPDAAALRRFKEFGGEIITVGSDAHDISRVGMHIPEALAMIGEIFGHVCTFEHRKPIFHKL